MTRNLLALAVCALLAVQGCERKATMVRLAGTPAEIGRIWGETNKRAIAHDMDVLYLKKAAAAGISEDALIERSQAFIRIAQEIAPHWLEEARAIARAAGVREDLYLSFVAGAVRNLFLHECTSYSVPRQYTLDGAILFHKTRDNTPTEQAAFVLESSLPGIHKFIAICNASRIDCCMMVNDQGLAGSADFPAHLTRKDDPNALLPEAADPQYRGIMNGHILRHIAERASTCAQALGIIEDLVKKGYDAGGKVNGTHWLFVDRRGMILEVSNNSRHVVSKFHTQKVYFSRVPTSRAAKQLRDAEQPIDFHLFHSVSRDPSICLKDSISSMTVEIEPSHPGLLTCAWVTLPARAGSFPLLMGQSKTPSCLLNGDAYLLGAQAKTNRPLWEATERSGHLSKESLKKKLLAAGATEAADLANQWSLEQAKKLLQLIRGRNNNVN